MRVAPRRIRRRGRAAASPGTPQALRRRDVIVDALFGTGLTRDVDWRGGRLHARHRMRRPARRRRRHSVRAARRHRRTCWAVAVRADLTVTFIGRKLGCYLGAGPDHVGRLVFDDLEVPLGAYDGIDARVARLLDEHVVAAALPRRARTAHKGAHGHVLVIGGGRGHGGRGAPRGRGGAARGRGPRDRGRASAEPRRRSASRPELMCARARGRGDLRARARARHACSRSGPGLGPVAVGAWRLFERGARCAEAAGRRCRRAQPAGARVRSDATTGC